MDTADWDSVMQFVQPLDLDLTPSTIQVLTPPDSKNGSPVAENNHTLVSVSTTFFPGSVNDPPPPDVILLSSDSVFFYVHSPVLLKASENNFMSLLPPPPVKSKDYMIPVISVSEPSSVLNVVLHFVYNMSCAHYSPSFDALTAAVAALDSYGLPPKDRILPSTHLFSLLLSHAPLHPLELYKLAARYDLYEMAVSTSSHLLSFPLPTITDEIAEEIGAVYLKRLFFLHFGRVDALKRLLLPPPHPHAPTRWCDFAEQKKLTRAWALAAAYLAWDTRPDLSTSTMESALNPLADNLSCELCQQTLKERIRNLVVQWSVVKTTI